MTSIVVLKDALKRCAPLCANSCVTPNQKTDSLDPPSFIAVLFVVFTKQWKYSKDTPTAAQFSTRIVEGKWKSCGLFQKTPEWKQMGTETTNVWNSQVLSTLMLPYEETKRSNFHFSVVKLLTTKEQTEKQIQVETQPFYVFWALSASKAEPFPLYRKKGCHKLKVNYHLVRFIYLFFGGAKRCFTTSSSLYVLVITICSWQVKSLAAWLVTSAEQPQS